MKQLLAREARRLLGTYLNTLLCYPDRHFHNEPVVDPANGNIIVDPAHLASDRISQKRTGSSISFMERSPRDEGALCVALAHSAPSDPETNECDSLSSSDLVTGAVGRAFRDVPGRSR